MSGESLFWRTTTIEKSKEEFEDWRSPEQTGLRLVESATAWLARALEQLPAECRDWFRIDFERPRWIEPAIPEQALHELQRLTIKMPDALPDWWGLDREQQRAAEVLMAIREAVHATHGMDAPRALVLIELTTDIGFRLAQAHIEPWEEVAATGKIWRDGGDKGRESRAKEAQERYARWQAMAEEEWRKRPHWSIRRAAQKVAKRLEEEGIEKPPSPDRIRNIITKPTK